MPFFSSNFCKLVGLLDGDGGVGFAVQDQHRTEAAHEEVHFFRHASEEFDDGFHARVDGGIGEREVGSQRKAEERDAFAIDCGWVSTKLIASQRVFIHNGKLRKMVGLSADAVPVRSK